MQNVIVLFGFIQFDTLNITLGNTAIRMNYILCMYTGIYFVNA
jgi:hypothetical protein